jgi:hypothetical protein
MLTLDQALIQLAELTAPGKTFTTQQLSALASQVVLDALPDKPQGSVTLMYNRAYQLKLEPYSYINIIYIV